MRTLVVLMAFFLLICSLLYAFGITGTRSPHSYHLKLVLALYDSIWIIRKLKKPPNNNIRRNSVALLTLFLLKYRLFYAFGIIGTRLTHSYYSKLFLTCYNSIWTIIKLRLPPNVDLQGNLVILIAFFILIYRLLYVFGVTGTRANNLCYSKLFLTPYYSYWTIIKIKQPPI